MRDNPIQIEYPYPSAVEVYTNKANSYKKSVEAALGGKVVINLVDAVDVGWMVLMQDTMETMVMNKTTTYDDVLRMESGLW